MASRWGFGYFSSAVVVDPYFCFNPGEMYELAQTVPSITDEVITTEWLIEYCKYKSLPLLLPVKFSNSIYAIMQRDANLPAGEPAYQQIPVNNDYCTEALSSLDAFLKALEYKKQRQAHEASKTNESKIRAQAYQELYHKNLALATGKDNLLAKYLSLYDHFSIEIKKKTLRECIDNFNEVEKTDFLRLLQSYDASVLIYITEIYFCFAKNLKIKLDEQKANPHKHYQEDEATIRLLLQETGDLINHCLKEAKKCLEIYKRYADTINEFSKASMALFTENMSGRNVDDIIYKLTWSISDLRNRNKPDVTRTVKLTKNRYNLVDVDPGRLPWSPQDKKSKAEDLPPITSSYLPNPDPLATLPPVVKDEPTVEMPEQNTTAKPPVPPPPPPRQKSNDEISTPNPVIPEVVVRREPPPVPPREPLIAAKQPPVVTVIKGPTLNPPPIPPRNATTTATVLKKTGVESPAPKEPASVTTNASGGFANLIQQRALLMQKEREKQDNPTAEPLQKNKEADSLVQALAIGLKSIRGAVAPAHESEENDEDKDQWNTPSVSRK